MYFRIQSRLKKLINSQQAHTLQGGLKGIEKESLRVTPQGNIAQTPHPRALGSALTNPYITTDYSEALLEFITPPFSNTIDTLSFMDDLHTFTHQNIGDELLWGASMPCITEGEMSIPIAQYGSSNIGKMKHLYRVGLWHRYGRKMQAIAGIHFNYSLPETFWPVYQQLEEDTQPLTDFISQSYFDMTRNLHRYGWVVLYLFGASPAICRSFLDGNTDSFQVFDDCTLYQPYGTSLRMSDIGYKNDSQSKINISYNALDKYVERLFTATQTPHPEYQKIPIKDEAGDYKQLNANILQIENEYYSNVRPKQIIKSGESPSTALKKRGVRYVELRSIDLGIYNRAGASEEQLRFLEAFMIFCLLADSPDLTTECKRSVDQNLIHVATHGRSPDFLLHRKGDEIDLTSWGLQICNEMDALCEILDADNMDKPYSKALQVQKEKFKHVELTPSARIIQSMTEQQLPFFDFSMQQSKMHQEYFKKQILSDAQSVLFQETSRKSIKEQVDIERHDEISFDAFLAQYLSSN